MTNVRAELPPGQRLTRAWPVLSCGPAPTFDPETWDFRVFGEVESELRLTYCQFRGLAQSEVCSDFHCVTGWSRLSNLWSGVLARDLLSLVRLRPRAAFVIAHCDGGYTTNMPLAIFRRPDVILAHRHDGSDLTPEHGWPVRLVVPCLYAWKSAKWVRAIELSAVDRPGYWEVRGYHNHGDPWSEQRYRYQERTW